MKNFFKFASNFSSVCKKDYFKDISLDLLKNLPKAELHQHLDGSVRISTVSDMLKSQSLTQYSGLSEEELGKLISVDENCHSLVDYLQGFDVTLSVMQNEQSISRIMYEVIEDASKDGIKYVEIRFSPILHTQEGLHLSSIMEAVIDGAFMAERDFPIIPRIIICGMRQLESHVTKQLAEIAWRYKDQGVISFDLAGPEYGFSSIKHREALSLIQERGVNLTLHSGEAFGWESVRDSLRYCGAQRIGHGVNTRQNEDLLNFVVNQRIPIESCVTSNFQTCAVQSYEDHPIRDYFDRGCVIVPCVDNTTVGGYTLSDEYHKIHKLYDFSITELIQLIDYGFISSFLPEYERKRLRSLMLNEMHEVLTNDIMEQSIKLDDKSMNLQKASVMSKELIEEGTKRSMKIPIELKTNEESCSASCSPILSSQERLYSDFRIGSYPTITPSLVEKLPKADCNCRINGSISVPTLWKFYQEVLEEGKDSDLFDLEFHGIPFFEGIQEMSEFLQPAIHDQQSLKTSINLMKILVQQKDRLERGIEDIFERAVSENLRYLELHVRPTLHLKEMSSKEVVETVVQKKREMEEKFSNAIESSVVVDVSTKGDGIHQIYQTISLINELRSIYPDDVVGFGIYGDEIDHYSSSMLKVANFCKENDILVSMFCGRNDTQSIMKAIHEGGARRLSGAFKIDQSPDILEYVSNLQIPVEIGLTDKMKIANPEIGSFAGTIFRFLLDHNVKLVPCSFDSTLYPETRSEEIWDIAKESNLSIRELVGFLSNGFVSGFVSLEKRQKMWEKFWEESGQILEENGFGGVKESIWFPCKEM